MLRESDRHKKTKQGQRPALDFSSFIPVASELFFFWSGCDWSRRRFFLPQTWTTPAPADANVTLIITLLAALIASGSLVLNKF
jgi:hypothetical protein